MFFMPILITLLQPSANTLLVFLQDAPVLVVVMAFFMFWVFCWLPIAIVIAIALKWKPGKSLQPEQKLPLLIPLYLLAPLILWGMSSLGVGSFADYGFVVNFSTLSSLLFGFALGVISLAIVFALQFLLGWCQWQTENNKLVLANLLPIPLIALLVGAIEELIFRGFLITELTQQYPVWLAAVISSVIFALLHLVWEQKETIPQLPGLWLMGIVLVLARFVDGGNLGIAWGLHAGWVWAIATLDTAELITYTGKVSEWLTGKNKKPLAGLAGIFCVLLTGIILWIFT
ncbi:CPBP family intramembrane metalloprotease [Tolypothrix sp. FACHB-123]|uniref:CPBP family intramembrane glutamic endopeptidase n=1 Tax=Tolypothrix sp. FACHB-123 TaxID=2692868 RepID=UPI001689A1D4|nr:CPBP family glutamic-type intramembrane protease [Tolypothrix sp. FACHB-123]MBD2357756.1 CPBP family intramembrane metalloprotease [Tolypothrix sp. FACHB-123]